MMKYLYEIQQAVRELLEDQSILSDKTRYTCNEIATAVVARACEFDASYRIGIRIAVKNTLSEIGGQFVNSVYAKAKSGEIQLSEIAMTKIANDMKIDYYRGTFIHDISRIGEKEYDLELFAEYRRQWLEFILTQSSEHENRRNA